MKGWQYAGSRLGIVLVVERVLSLGEEVEIKYQAKVSLLDLHRDCVVGAGFTVCSSLEDGRRGYQEFAIISMAQTRAVGKTFRNSLAWLVRAAGYEATPAEEMDYQTTRSEAGAARVAAALKGPAPAPALVEAVNHPALEHPASTGSP